jgi:hypothetical protein
VCHPTLAAHNKVYAEQLNKALELRAVADVQFGRDPAEWNLCTGYEASSTIQRLQWTPAEVGITYPR